MTTAIIGTGGIGSAIARRLASGGETLRLSSADPESARVLAAKIGRLAVVAVDNRDALWGADAVVLALRFPVLKGVIDEIADPLTDKLVVVPSNPVGIDAQGNVGASPAGRAILWRGRCRVVAGGGAPGHGVWKPVGRSLRVLQQPVTGAGGPFYATDDDRAGGEVERLIRAAGFEPVKVGGIEQSSRLEVGGDLHDLVVGPAEARSLIGGS